MHFQAYSVGKSSQIIYRRTEGHLQCTADITCRKGRGLLWVRLAFVIGTTRVSVRSTEKGSLAERAARETDRQRTHPPMSQDQYRFIFKDPSEHN